MMQPTKLEWSKKPWTTISFKSETGKDMDSIFTKEKIKKLENYEALSKIREHLRNDLVNGLAFFKY